MKTVYAVLNSDWEGEDVLFICADQATAEAACRRYNELLERNAQVGTLSFLDSPDEIRLRTVYRVDVNGLPSPTSGWDPPNEHRQSYQEPLWAHRTTDDVSVYSRGIDPPQMWARGYSYEGFSEAREKALKALNQWHYDHGWKVMQYDHQKRGRPEKVRKANLTKAEAVKFADDKNARRGAESEWAYRVAPPDFVSPHAEPTP